MQRFHHSQFCDFSALAEIKCATNQSVSVCIPTLNEADTIGEIISTLRVELLDKHSLIDEIIVVDSGSIDDTRKIATASGAKVYLANDISPERGQQTGKGENLWKALHVSNGKLICFIDGDISNFHPGFVMGLIGPLLTDSNIDYVKAFYERPLAYGDELHSTGGGRVSEILIRPLISLFYPELAVILQPLSGEYAARRETFENLAFPIGYGVEIAHLIDLLCQGNLSRIAQTDLVRRVHRNRNDNELGNMAFALLRVVIRRLERDGKISLRDRLPDLYQSWIMQNNDCVLSANHIPEPERPPLRSIQAK